MARRGGTETSSTVTGGRKRCVVLNAVLVCDAELGMTAQQARSEQDKETLASITYEVEGSTAAVAGSDEAAWASAST